MSTIKGAFAEAAARQWLEQQGLSTVTTNYRCREGEIDLIMQQGDVIVFIEVRHRTTSRYASATGSVNPQKQRKIRRTAQDFLYHHPQYQNFLCRFDMIAYDGRVVPKATPIWLRQIL